MAIWRSCAACVRACQHAFVAPRAAAVVAIAFGASFVSGVQLGATTVVAAPNGAKVAQEPQAAWTDRTGVVAYADGDASTKMGWASTINGGATWDVCNADDTPSGCNGGKTDFSALKDGAKLVPLDHHALAAEGPRTVNGVPKNRVVYVTSADVDKNPKTAERIVAAVSTNGGRTFPKAYAVNDDSCSGGTQDMPHAAFDYTTSPPTLWVVWRHQEQSGLGGSFGACIRRFFLDGSDALAALDDAQDVEGMDLEDVTGSQGGLKVQAGDGVVTVVYSNTDHLFKCPDDSKRGVGWGSVSSFDEGHDWTDNSRIYHTEDFRWCVLDVPSGNNGKAKPAVQNSIRAFDFARSPAGVHYVAINDAVNTIRLFMNPAAGTKGWQNPTSTIRTWFEWCPLTGTADLDPNNPGTIPTSNWLHITDDHRPCPRAAFEGTGGVAIFPSLAVDGDGAVSLSFYEGALTQGQLQVEYCGNVDPQSPRSQTAPFGPDFQCSRVAQAFDPPDALKLPLETVVQPLGSYFSIAARSSATGTVSEPGCNGNANVVPPAFDLWPFWVQRTATSSAPQVAVRKVVLSP